MLRARFDGDWNSRSVAAGRGRSGAGIGKAAKIPTPRRPWLMLAVAEALSLVLQQARPLAPQAIAVGAALGRVLAEPVASDLDSPPYTKSLMDAYAVRSGDCASLPITLKVIDEVAAGHVSVKVVGPGEAVRIMTGAPVPAGADAVVPVEKAEPLPEAVRITGKAPSPGRNVLERGRELRAGETALHAGMLLRPQELGILASVGRTTISVFPSPRIAIMTTGDEVVEAPQVPGPGQIRNSNGPMLLAQAERAGAEARYLGIAHDNVESLQSMIGEGLTGPNVLILSGGVSAGKFDLVPGVLQELGVVPHFHKVALKPGKPLFFGTRDVTLDFGLPGNPVSSFVCCELFIRPAIRQLAGEREPGPRQAPLPIAEDFRTENDRPTYHPARLEIVDQGLRVRPLPWFGSADLRGISGANALLALPPGVQSCRAGESVPVILLET